MSRLRAHAAQCLLRHSRLTVPADTGLEEDLAMIAQRKNVADQRQQAWRKLQTEAPDVAELLKLVADTFGRPESVRIEVDGKTLIDTYPRRS